MTHLGSTFGRPFTPEVLSGVTPTLLQQTTALEDKYLPALRLLADNSAQIMGEFNVADPVASLKAQSDKIRQTSAALFGTMAAAANLIPVVGQIISAVVAAIGAGFDLLISEIGAARPVYDYEVAANMVVKALGYASASPGKQYVGSLDTAGLLRMYNDGWFYGWWPSTSSGISRSVAGTDGRGISSAFLQTTLCRLLSDAPACVDTVNPRGQPSKQCVSERAGAKEEQTSIRTRINFPGTGRGIDPLTETALMVDFKFNESLKAAGKGAVALTPEYAQWVAAVDTAYPNGRTRFQELFKFGSGDGAPKPVIIGKDGVVGGTATGSSTRPKWPTKKELATKWAKPGVDPKRVSLVYDGRCWSTSMLGIINSTINMCSGAIALRVDAVPEPILRAAIASILAKDEEIPDNAFVQWVAYNLRAGANGGYAFPLFNRVLTEYVGTTAAPKRFTSSERAAITPSGSGMTVIKRPAAVPFYKKWWFYALAGLGAASTILTIAAVASRSKK